MDDRLLLFLFTIQALTPTSRLHLFYLQKSLDQKKLKNFRKWAILYMNQTVIQEVIQDPGY